MKGEEVVKEDKAEIKRKLKSKVSKLKEVLAFQRLLCRAAESDQEHLNEWLVMLIMRETKIKELILNSKVILF